MKAKVSSKEENFSLICVYMTTIYEQSHKWQRNEQMAHGEIVPMTI